MKKKYKTNGIQKIHKIFYNQLTPNINQHYINQIGNKYIKLETNNYIPIRTRFRNNRKSTKQTIGFVEWIISK
jgi:hypothetical protein